VPARDWPRWSGRESALETARCGRSSRRQLRTSMAREMVVLLGIKLGQKRLVIPVQNAFQVAIWLVAPEATGSPPTSRPHRRRDFCLQRSYRRRRCPCRRASGRSAIGRCAAARWGRRCGSRRRARTRRRCCSRLRMRQKMFAGVPTSLQRSTRANRPSIRAGRGELIVLGPESGPLYNAFAIDGSRTGTRSSAPLIRKMSDSSASKYRGRPLSSCG